MPRESGASRIHGMNYEGEVRDGAVNAFREVRRQAFHGRFMEELGDDPALVDPRGDPLEADGDFQAQDLIHTDVVEVDVEKRLLDGIPLHLLEEGGVGLAAHLEIDHPNLGADGGLQIMQGHAEGDGRLVLAIEDGWDPAGAAKMADPVGAEGFAGLSLELLVGHGGQTSSG